jgi:tetratricopeptide (TPR) repeat protein
MLYQLLLVDGRGEARAAALRIRTLREFPALDGLSVHFRPVRNDMLYESAKVGGRLAYRILIGEGIVRSQLVVEYEVLGEHLNCMGRSSELLFALALLTAKWTQATPRFAAIAATGVLDGEGAVQSVERAPEKIAAAIRDLAESGLSSASKAVIFYPAADALPVAQWRATANIPAQVELRPVAHLEEALAHLEYGLGKVYLRNPYRGLEQFEYQHHAIFFGRDREVREAVQQLLRRETAGVPGLLVEGASGSGKSSFLQAGLLPALVERRFQSEAVQEALGHRPFSLGAARAVWRPGRLGADMDEAKLAQSIRDCWMALPELAAGGVQGEVHDLAELEQKRRHAWPESMRFVWVIDQFEELLNLKLPDALIEAFGRFLNQLQQHGVWTLTSVRSDALPELKRHAALRQVFGANEGQYYLATLSGTALDAVINLPARAADLTFAVGPEGKPLDEMLREDAYREAGCLPQLQYTLNELYQKRVGKELSVAVYLELGGLAGSIATTTARLLSAEGVDTQRAVPRLFRSLVSVDDTGGATRRYAPLIDISADPAQNSILLRLIEARLCVTDQRDGQAVVAFAHDTLLKTLPALTDWLKQEAGLLQTRDLAQRETKQWQQHARSDAWLAAADKVTAFKALEAAQIVLPEAERNFIGRSIERVRRNTRLKRAAVSVIALLGVSVVIGAFALLWQQRRADEAREMAVRRGEFLENLLKSADPHAGRRDITMAELLDSAAKQLDQNLKNEPLVEASMLGLIADTDTGLGRYPEALAADERQIALLKSHDAAPLDIARALIARGSVLNTSGHYADAKPVLVEALNLLQALPGADGDHATTLFELGRAAHLSGDEAEAEKLYREVIARDRRGDDAMRRNLGGHLQNLSVLLSGQGRYDESAAVSREALAMYRQYWPADYPEALISEAQYGIILMHLHRPAEAEPVFRDVLAREVRVLGPEHADTLVAQTQLGESLIDLERYPEAEKILRATAESLGKVLGPEHRYTTGTWLDYARAACHGVDPAAGLAAAQRVADIRAKTLPAGDWHQAGAQTNIGFCLTHLHRYAEAETILRKAAFDLEAVRGARFYSTQLAYKALRDLYLATGRGSEAQAIGAKIQP